MQGLFMFYMSGSNVSMFTIMIVIQFLMNPIKAISGINDAFKPYEHKDVNLLLPKLAFIGINLGLFGMAIWKLQALGVIPVTPADWSGIISTRVPIQHN